MKIRPYRESDFVVVVDIYAKSKLDELIYEERDFELVPLELDSKRLAQFRESDIYVYDDNGVVGYGAVFESEIRALFVHPTNRGKGVGRQLLEFLLTRINGPVSLSVAKSNTPAKTLYENYGFTVVDEFDSIYNEVAVRAYKMMRSVPFVDNK